MLMFVADIITETIVPGLKQSQQTIIEEHHMILIVLVLILAFIMIGAGRGVGTLINAWIRKYFGATQAVTVKIGEDGQAMGDRDTSQRICKFTPEQCADHKAEFERSKRNVKDIEDLRQEFSEFKTAFFGKLATIETGVNDIKVTLAGTTAALNLRLEHGEKY